MEGNPAVLRRLQEKGNLPVATCVIVRGELIFMAENSERKTANLTRVQAFLQGIQIYPLDSATAEIYGQFRNHRLFRPQRKKKAPADPNSRPGD